MATTWPVCNSYAELIQLSQLEDYGRDARAAGVCMNLLVRSFEYDTESALSQGCSFDVFIHRQWPE